MNLKFIKNKLKYKKFSNETGRILIIHSGYFLIKEMASAAVECGDKVKLLPLYDSIPKSPSIRSTSSSAKESFLEELLLSLIEFKPDFVFTVNMIGFDKEGFLANFLSELNVLVVNYFVDTPFGILEDNLFFDKSNFISFCWEKTYISDFKKRYKKHHIKYLPYATMLKGNESFSFSRFEEISFIGSSMYGAYNEWLIKANISKKIEEDFKLFFDKRPLQITERIETFFLENNIVLDMSKTFFYFAGSMLTRQSIVSLLSKNFDKLSIYGDDGWKKNNYNHTNIYGYLDYYKQTPGLYNSSKISLNITSPQMKTAINQRVYDTFAAGGFLISDYREDLDLVIGKNKVEYFTSNEELVDKINFYLKNDTLRKKNALEIKQLILKNHRYVNRLKEIKRYVKEIYKSRL